MSWETTMVTILRELIADNGITQTYTDANLKRSLVIAAAFILREVVFDQTYTVNIDDVTISPDPATSDPVDYNFMALSCYKSACMILRAEAKGKANMAASVSDAGSTINMAGVYKAVKEEADNMCRTYDQLLVQHKLGNSNLGYAVSGPVTTLNVGPAEGNF